MWKERLPPLTALRAFEAAARHMSFAKAAEELGVTAAALSFQIKSLEEHLGEPVFRRLNRAIELTEVGLSLRPGVADGFDALTAAWRMARRRVDARGLTVTAGPAFTAKWLAPRLFSFAQAHPEIELSFSASLRLVDMGRDDIDLAVRYGYGPDDGMYSLPLMSDWYAPMMTPELAQAHPDPATWPGGVLIQTGDTAFLDPPCDWASWFAASGFEMPELTGPRLNQADHAIDAALEGAGVVLGRSSLAHKALREGRLVLPHPVALTSEAHFRVICARGAENRPQVKAFLEWIEAQAQSMEVPRQGLKFVPAAEVAAARRRPSG